jgi:hypothetical protein
MSFSQSVYSNLSDANEQLQDYFTGLIQSRAWNPEIVAEMNVWVQAVNDNNEHWYGDDVQQFWVDIAEGYRPTVDRLTQDNPSTLQNWDGIGRVLGADVPRDPTAPAGETVTPAGIAYDTAQASGVSGAINVAQDELDDFARRQAARNERYEKLAPFILPVVGLAGIYVVIKALR